MTTITTFVAQGSLLARWGHHLLRMTGARLRGPAGRRAEAVPRDADGDMAAVRALADSYRKSDPGFASDLYAAADRHERELAAEGRAPTQLAGRESLSARTR